jgi:thiol-disulfide isomerase/thioredoxin
VKKLLTILFLTTSLSGFAQNAEILSFEQLSERYMESDNDTLYILNFWATWCAPCVKELPFFEQSRIDFKDQPVSIILVSLDFKNQIESRLNPFIKSRGLKNKVVFLEAPAENIWIPKVSEQWSGAIPATLMVNPKKGCRYFYEKEFKNDELNNLIKTNLKLCSD